MNDELQRQLAELLKSLTSTVQDGSSWAKGQIPLLVQEKLRLGRVEESLYAFVAFAAVALAITAIVKLNVWRKRAENGTMDRGDRLMALIFASVILVPASGIFFMEVMHDFFTVWIAPRLYLVEWLQGML